MAQTEGKTRVNLMFNPSGNSSVDSFKTDAAALIDRMLDIQNNSVADHHEKRWAAEAATCIETGAVFAVKALTHYSCDQ